jgi:glycosyltransferase involved in cell wall biosynthesis
LEPRGYRTRLVRGRESPSEGNMDYIAEQLGVKPTFVSSMRRDPSLRDVIALSRLIWMLRRDRPAIVHTHAAKAGTLGRFAAVIAYPRRSRRPLLVHTYHGHSLTGYFSSRTARFYRRIEQWLGATTDTLIAVSDDVRDDLVRLRVAASERFVVIPLGFDLSQFLEDRARAERRAALRREWGVRDDEQVVTLVARLVPIKRVDRFLAIARRLADRPGTRFVIVGDGELRERLKASADAIGFGDQLIWTGFRRDMPDVCFASDVVVLTSDNEGTPVSLIEAQAAAVPVVSTEVGGVRSVVRHGETGLLAACDDVPSLARAVASILDDRELAARLSSAGRKHAKAAFSVTRLVEDHDELYRRLLVHQRSPLA